jgi:hypothetical protein
MRDNAQKLDENKRYLGKHDLLRLAVLLLIAVVLLGRILTSHSGAHPSTIQIVNSLEILVLLAPLLWINSKRRLAMGLLMLFLIWLGFESFRCYLAHQYWYSLGFATVCTACTFKFLRGRLGLRDRHASHPNDG